MRYFLIKYIQRPNGQYDEISEIRKNIKPQHYRNFSVILDFKKLEVVQAHVNGVSAGRDWEKLFQTYVQHYRQQFDMMLDYNHGPEIAKPTASVDLAVE